MYTLQTHYPVAVESLDHLHPNGTMIDNNSSADFIAELESFVSGRPIRLCDLGCSGGQFVIDMNNRGHRALGLEGSDYSAIRNRANWPNPALFTCDITKPFTVLWGEEECQFDVITAWEVLEHIPMDDLPNLVERMASMLTEGGYFIGTVSHEPFMWEGVNLHVSAMPIQEWEKLLSRRFEIVPFPFHHTVRDDALHAGISKPICGRKL